MGQGTQRALSVADLNTLMLLLITPDDAKSQISILQQSSEQN